MMTFYTIPKPFVGHVGVIQRNAIRSWTRLRPECEIILFGDEEGIPEIAAELGVRNIPVMARNECGTPLLDDVFAQAARAASHEWLCYMNADVIFLGDVMSAFEAVKARFLRPLMVGQRWEIKIDEELGLDDQWETELKERLRTSGRLDIPHAIEYFIFKKGALKQIPPFAVGRTIYDNWFVFRGRQLGLDVVDTTEMVTCIHQSHDRTFASMGKKTPDAFDDCTRGQEAQRNRELAGGVQHAFTITDVCWRLTQEGFVRNFCGDDSPREAEVAQLLRPESKWLSSPIGSLWTEIWTECRIRIARVGTCGWLPLLKVLPWVARRILHPPVRV